MLSIAIAVLVMFSTTSCVVGPQKPLNLSVTLADAAGEPCNDHLSTVKLLRAESPTASPAEMIEIAEVPAPSPTGFDENGQPYVVRFENLPQGSMVEGTTYYFFTVLTDEALNESAPSAPSEDTYVDRTPPDAVGTAPVFEE